MSPYPFRVVRTFAPPNVDDGPQLSRVLELPLTPHRGQDVKLPGAAGVLRIARVVVTARVASPNWEPGFRTTELVRVELEPEAPAGYDRAVLEGWTPVT